MVDIDPNTAASVSDLKGGLGMLDEKDVRRKNPKASDDLDALREAFETLHKLQQAGIVREDTFRPARVGRISLEDLKPKRSARVF